MNNTIKKLVLNATCGSILMVATVNVFAMLPPRYLSVRNFDQCLMSRNYGGERFWCMPTIRPAFCPGDSWYRLERLAVEDRIPTCRDHFRHYDRYTPPPRPYPVVVPVPVFDIHIGGHHHHDEHHDDHHDDHHDHHHY